MVKSLLTECVSVPMLGDVGNPSLRVSRLEPCSVRQKSSRGDGRASPNACHNQRSGLLWDSRGAGSQSQAQARRRQHPRSNSASSETEIALEGEPNVGRGGYLCLRDDMLFLSY
jgi:hypothetical protein